LDKGQEEPYNRVNGISVLAWASIRKYVQMFHIPWKFVVNIGENEETNFIKAFPPYCLMVNAKLCLRRLEVVNIKNVDLDKIFPELVWNVQIHSPCSQSK
jgi:hypothetical protein